MTIFKKYFIFMQTYFLVLKTEHMVIYFTAILLLFVRIRTIFTKKKRKLYIRVLSIALRLTKIGVKGDENPAACPTP